MGPREPASHLKGATKFGPAAGACGPVTTKLRHTWSSTRGCFPAAIRACRRHSRSRICGGRLRLRDGHVVPAVWSARMQSAQSPERRPQVVVVPDLDALARAAAARVREAAKAAL